MSAREEILEAFRLFFEESGCPLTDEQMKILEKGRSSVHTLDQQAMWDAMTILGQDTDGDTTPAHVIAGMGGVGYRQMFLHFISNARREHDEAINEVCMSPKEHER